VYKLLIGPALNGQAPVYLMDLLSPYNPSRSLRSLNSRFDLSNFERGMVVGARRASLSISLSAQLLGFSHTTISGVYKEWCEKGKTSRSEENEPTDSS